MQLNDYNTLLAVIGGLGHSAITRLHKTIELLSVEDQLVSIFYFHYFIYSLWIICI